MGEVLCALFDRVAYGYPVFCFGGHQPPDTTEEKYMVFKNQLFAVGWMLSGLTAAIFGHPMGYLLACVAIGAIHGVAADIISAIKGAANDLRR